MSNPQEATPEEHAQPERRQATSHQATPHKAMPAREIRLEQQAPPEKQGRNTTTIAEIALADEPRDWEALGFAVQGEEMWLGEVRVVLAGRDAGKGILGWSLRGIADTALDGLPTTISKSPGAGPEPVGEDRPGGPPVQARPNDGILGHLARELGHPNGVRALDHVVAMSPNLDRGVDRLRAAGLDLRRIRERPTPAGAPRQAFFRLGGVILELVQEPAEVVQASREGCDGPTRFWGLALLTEDIEHTAGVFAGHCGEVRPAVQYGRWIATVKRSAGLSLPVALMSPAVE